MSNKTPVRMDIEHLFNYAPPAPLPFSAEEQAVLDWLLNSDEEKAALDRKDEEDARNNGAHPDQATKTTGLASQEKNEHQGQHNTGLGSAVSDDNEKGDNGGDQIVRSHEGQEEVQGNPSSPLLCQPKPKEPKEPAPQGLAWYKERGEALDGTNSSS